MKRRGRRLTRSGKALQEKLNDVVRMVRESEKTVKEAIAKLEKDATLSAVGIS